MSLLRLRLEWWPRDWCTHGGWILSSLDQLVNYMPDQCPNPTYRANRTALDLSFNCGVDGGGSILTVRVEVGIDNGSQVWF